MAELQKVSDIIESYSGLSRVVLDYCQIMGSLVDEAKKPGFGAGGWDPIKALVDAENFVRIGNFKELMRWDDYAAFLTSWAGSAEWECSFRRITELGGLVFLELEERSEMGEFRSVVNSMSVYEFNAGGKIEHIDVYLQMEPPPAEMLASYDN